jgi:ADP-ribosylglycohydrolase/predicted enzyme related to lactoylglutathione lyase
MTHYDSPGGNRLSLVVKAQGALLAAAVGDALGWPQEDRSRRADKPPTSPEERPHNQYQQWVRRSGGRFYPFEEIILAGEYSDDTQLLLCTARSILAGTEWWRYLTKRELPAWILYERGGGGATKRAAEMWLAGHEPWSSPKKLDRQRYFDAGGNGVAMRIMPHCLIDISEPDFGKIARDIVVNGVCTHGHPIALVGALAYGFATWIAFRETETLPYGEIIEKVVSAVDAWSNLHNFEDIWPTWRRSANEITAHKYDESWREAVEEMLQLLGHAQEGMKQGALSVDREVLKKLGCFDRKVSGAGTRAAAASIFLASRYAADPFNGLIAAAFANGADTDTIASMTGGLLGAINGIEWLQDHSKQVQDAHYLSVVGEHLAQKKTTNLEIKPLGLIITRQDLSDFLKQLEISNLNDKVLFPDDREAQISKQQSHRPRAKNTFAISWKLVTTDGQSLYVKKLSRSDITINGEFREASNTAVKEDSKFEPREVDIVKSGVKILVRDMVRARTFYEKVLGLKVMKESGFFVNVGGVIALVLVDHEKILGEQPKRNLLNKNIIIYIETRSLTAVYENVTRFGAEILCRISHSSGRRFFRCLDPDRNVVEISEIIESM